jgi:hypothetical protein
VGTEKSRKERINELLEIMENNGNTNFVELYGIFAVRYGCTLRTFYSYLKVLELAGKVGQVPSYQTIKQHLGL